MTIRFRHAVRALLMIVALLICALPGKSEAVARPTTQPTLAKPAAYPVASDCSTSGDLTTTTTTINADSSYQTNYPANAIDNSQSTYWGGGVKGSGWIAVDFGSSNAQQPYQAKFTLNTDGGFSIIKIFQVQYSSNNSSWTTVYSNTVSSTATDGTVVRARWDRPTNEYRYWRINILSTYPNPDFDNEILEPSIAELEFFDPCHIVSGGGWSPDAIFDSPLQAQDLWPSGANNTEDSYRVYFDTAAEVPANFSSVGSFKLYTSLTSGKTYHFQGYLIGGTTADTATTRFYNYTSTLQLVSPSNVTTNLATSDISGDFVFVEGDFTASATGTYKLRVHIPITESNGMGVPSGSVIEFIDGSSYPLPLGGIDELVVFEVP